MLIDDVHITVKAGSGGNGAATLKRNAMTIKGGPDGGNGGNGGNVYFQGINDILGLRDFQFKKNIEAESGIKGAKQNLYGRNGKDTIIRIPLGTLITDEESGEEWEVTDEETTVLLSKGGRGGRGNNEFKSATNQTPTFAEKGQPGQERKIHLELKLIADIGFIGLPNAGKSSLLEMLTNAHPKIANYPFTTLEPNLGVMIQNSHSRSSRESVLDPRLLEDDKNIILADIPGLIEGASKGKGLGIKFLKHVEKTQILVHCIDATTENVEKTYEVVRHELDSFSQALMQKQEIILITKSDLVDGKELEKKVKEAKKINKDVYSVSIYDEHSVNELRITLQKLLEKK